LTLTAHHSSDETAPGFVDAPRKLFDRPGAVFAVSLTVRIILASVFLGGADAMNAVAVIPPASTHTFFVLPYFPIVQNILGATTPLVTHAHFLPIGLTVKLVPCLVDSLLSVWLLENNRFDRRYRRRSAWLYTFCPLPLILVCLNGQWDSLWILPAVTAIAMSDLLTSATKARRTTLLLIGALLGLAVLSKPSALIVAGLLLPSFRYRESVFNWFYEAALIVMGALIMLVAFFLKFAANGVHVHQNIIETLQYAGQPGATLFGPADLSIFRHLNSLHAQVLQDFRQLSFVYVFAIVVYQLIARKPVDRMTAAAAALLICPAIGGMAPNYLLWPFVFIIASGRLRIASVYAIVTSCLYFLFFLIPGASYNPGVNLGALLPLRSLRSLGLPLTSLRWFSARAALDVWHPLANLVVPLAMCALGVFLLVSRPPDASVPQPATCEPLELRSVRTIAPYTALMVLVVIAYGMVSTHDVSATIAAIYHGVNDYAFARPIYSWRLWSTNYFWTAKHPYRDILGGSWWGTILVLGPLGIAAWGAFAIRASWRSTPRPRDVDHEPA
jgi:hypothetical protein